MQFLIQAEWVQQEAEEQDVKVSDAEVKRSFEDQKKQAFPNDKAYQEFLKTSGMTEEDILFRVKLDPLQHEAHAEGDQGRGQGHRRGRRGLLRQEQEALRPARAARPATSCSPRPRPRPTRPRAASRTARASRPSPRSTRSTRPPRPRAASCPTWPRASRRRRSTRPSSPPRRARSWARSRPSSATTSSRSTKITPASQQSLAAGQGDDQEPAPVPAPAEGARRVHQGLPRGVQGRRPPAPTTTGSPSARTRPKEQTDTGAASGGAPAGPGARRARRRPRRARRAAGAAPQGCRSRPAGRRAAAPAPGPVAGWRADAGRERGRPVEALARLDEITRRLRRECPWDREQDERSIVPHTVEEAYELADAAHLGDDAQAARRARRRALPGLLPGAAPRGARRGRPGAPWPTSCREKLIRRHPHVFGEREAATAGDVRAQLGARSSASRSAGGEMFGDLPETLPSTLYAKKVLKRARSAGHESDGRRGRPRRPAPGRCARGGARPACDPELGAAGGGATRLPRPGESAGQHERDREGARPPDPRQPGQPDRRGRRARWPRAPPAARPCPPAPPPASSRPWSCATAATPGAARA